MYSRFLAVLVARNYEFMRDRSALGWNLVFPILMVIGFAFVFSDDNKVLYKVGVMNTKQEASQPFQDLRHLEFVEYADMSTAELKLQQHKIDILVDFKAKSYWVNQSSASGYIVEKLFLGQQPDFVKFTIDGKAIRYLDWVVPGILGVNMMFSCLFGVGYVIVRYRKNSVLKRLNATPLRAIEFLSAQVLSRLVIVMIISSGIFVACNVVFDFYMLGNYFTLLLVAFLGTSSIISLALLIACRSESEEFIGGMLNLISWPMMMLSGVWFSLEGSPEFIQQLTKVFPLTHMLESARAVMLDGAGLSDIWGHLVTLALMTVVFLLAGSYFFKWQGEAR
ncbi:ABC transporter permease [Vibrio penaeicida]|uniref:Transport permease protein n=1 Tax=Vibrio penaeicida TaxID=104609 RepID=A0AAV5NUD5_9VIBR|nr:ABC transporter permease [Vibrio penaeicida]RTZ22611.1 ABC transporter permease [Vibrio penaeicida]GLQ74200.1 transport permease protein [Vibrio penaeicida]